jgi:glycosyltransferase involved in cell wall biosynthesis
MKVGVDGRLLQPGFKESLARGLGLYATELVRELARMPEIELTLFYDSRLPVPSRPGLDGVARRSYPGSWPAHPHARTQMAVPFGMRSVPLDVFHFLAHGDAPVLMAGNAVVTVHDLILEAMGRLYTRRPVFKLMRWLERIAVERAPFVLADSRRSRDDLVDRFGVASERIHVVPLGLDPRFRPPEPGRIDAIRARLGLENPFVLHLGGIDARKNLPLLLGAFRKTRLRRGGNLDLVLAGPIQQHRDFAGLMAQARALGYGDELRLPGYVADDDLPALLGAARVLAFPSLYEGFGLPPLEAMACGTPVVASQGGALQDVVGDAAVRVPDGDEDAFAEALLGVIADESLRADLRERGLRQATGFTWQRTARATVEGYRMAITARSRR